MITKSCLAFCFALLPWTLFADSPLESALAKAGANREQMELALKQVPEAQREGMAFLIEHMPERDLTTLTADFLLKNVQLAYQAWEEAPWKDQIPHHIFLNDVLPYASITETREDWRSDFHARFSDLVKEAKTPSEAAVILNQNIFQVLSVKYSTKRKRADQSPSESIEQGLASCSGLSVMLIDACRAVGVPARFVGTPLWTNNSGNHSWVEIYDNGWHFTGACESTGPELNKGWFIGNASQAERDNPLHAIYATSYRKTSIAFPMVWDRGATYVHAVNVTDRYTRLQEKLPEGVERVGFVAMQGDTDQRVSLPLSVADAEGKVLFTGKTNNEDFDRNDHVTVPLKLGETYDVTFGVQPAQQVKAVGNHQLVVFKAPDSEAETASDSTEAPGTSDEAGLTQRQVRAQVARLWKQYSDAELAERRVENEKREIKIGERTMPFWYKVFGRKPKEGRSLYISMHGGGGAPPRVNDRQYENQKGLYEPAEGVYFVPRAPTDTWNLWHEAHIDDFFQRVIENMVLLEGVNPDRVYIMGYSAGGDGVFQLAPRLADRLAAASMMAGHPNETTPEGLRNLPFTIHMGERDGAYERNKKAAQWKTMLAELHEQDPAGYIHEVTIHPGLGHWMNRQDAIALPWMAKFTRNRTPDLVVWKQDDVTHNRFYWLAIDAAHAKKGAVVRVKRDGNTFEILQSDVPKLTIRVNDEMIDFGKNVVVTYQGKTLFDGKLNRSKSVVEKTFEERHDPLAVFSAEVEVVIP